MKAGKPINQSNSWGTTLLAVTLSVVPAPASERTQTNEYFLSKPCLTVADVSGNQIEMNGFSDQEVVISFAQKLYANSTDIDPEIGRAAKKIMWDLI